MQLTEGISIYPTWQKHLIISPIKKETFASIKIEEHEIFDGPILNVDNAMLVSNESW